MSDAKAPQQEPSMEEILASIRRIISEDSEAPKADGAAQPAPAPAMAPAPPPVMAPAPSMDLDEDILDLTQRADPVPEPPLMAAPQPEALFEFEQQEGDIDADEMNVPEVDFSEGLMSRASANAAEDAFSRLTSFDEATPMMVAATSVPQGALNQVLETLVKDALKPILKQWLDVHLPPMVEELVRQEIQRLAQAGRRK